MGVGGSELKGVICVSAGEAFAEAYAAASAGVSGVLAKVRTWSDALGVSQSQRDTQKSPSVTNAARGSRRGAADGAGEAKNKIPNTAIMCHAHLNQRMRLEPRGVDD